MKPKLQRTYTPTPADIEHEWYVVDASDVPLGRLASKVAQVLRGKHNPTFAPHMDGGDFVVVVNASKVAVTGMKETEKIYYRHSGYPGGLRAEPLGRVRERQPERYAGPEHPHAAQVPRPLPLDHRKVEA